MNDYQYLKIVSRVYPLIYSFLTKPNSHLLKNLKLANRDWEIFFNLLHRNKMIPFTYHLISCEDCQKQVPKKYLQELKNLFNFYIFSGEFYKKEKEKIQGECQKKKISLILLKDLSRFNLNYPENIFSSQNDWDFLARPKNRKKINLLLKALEYRLIKTVSIKEVRPFTIPQNQYFKKRPFPLNIELKFKLLPQDSQDISALTTEKINFLTKNLWRSYKKNGINYPSLEQELLFLTLHLFFKDSMQGLKNLFDIHLLIEKKGKKINWSTIIKITKKLGITNYFVFVLLFCQKVFNTKLPEMIKKYNNIYIKIALFLYSPVLASTVLSTKERVKNRKFCQIKNYFSLIKYILTPISFYHKFSINKLAWFIKTGLPFWIRLMLLETTLRF